jgi:hypothetical protein
MIKWEHGARCSRGTERLALTRADPKKTSRLPGKVFQLAVPTSLQVSDPRPPAKRLFRYPHIARHDLDCPFLALEFVRCGRPGCRCQWGLRHGPYWYLRYEEWDRNARVIRHRREYVSKDNLRRVRRWLRRYRERGGSRAALQLFKR